MAPEPEQEPAYQLLPCLDVAPEPVQRSFDDWLDGTIRDSSMEEQLRWGQEFARTLYWEEIARIGESINWEDDFHRQRIEIILRDGPVTSEEWSAIMGYNECGCHNDCTNQ
jgi:hypothetical protein